MSHTPSARPSRRTLLPGRPVAADRIFLVRATFSGFFATMAFALYALYVVRDAGLTPFQIVIVGAALEGSTLLFEVPTGVIADAVSRRLSVLIGIVGFGLGIALMGLFPGIEGILAGQAVLGFGWACISGAQDAWLADELDEERAAAVYPRAAQWRQGASVLGTLVALPLGLIDRQLPLIVGGFGLASLAIPMAMTMTEDGWSPPHAEVARNLRGRFANVGTSARDGFRAVTASAAVRLGLLVAFLMGASSEAFDRLWGYHLIENVGLPSGINETVLFGALALAAQLGGFAVTAAARRVTDTSSLAVLGRLLSTFYAVIAGAVAALALAPAFGVAIAAYLATTFARNAEPGFFTAWVNRGLDSRTRATVLSSVGQGDAFGQLLGGPIFAVIAGAGSATAALLVGAAFILPAAFLVRTRPLTTAAVAPAEEPT